MEIQEAKHLLRNNKIAIYLDTDLSNIKTILKETFPEEGEKDFHILKSGQYIRRAYGSWDAYEKSPFGYDVVNLSEIEMKEKEQLGWLVKSEYLLTVERILGFKLNENPYGHFGIKSIVEEDLVNLKNS